MEPSKKTARLAGILYLSTAVTAPFSLIAAPIQLFEVLGLRSWALGWRGIAEVRSTKRSSRRFLTRALIPPVGSASVFRRRGPHLQDHGHEPARCPYRNAEHFNATYFLCDGLRLHPR
jgi:hypothetical protein